MVMMARVDCLERQIRRWTALAWLVLTAMALQGVWQGRRAQGRKVGRLLTEQPIWLYAVVGPAYALLLLPLWRPLPLRLSQPARLAATVGGSLLSALGLGLIVAGRLALGDLYNVSSAFGVRLNVEHRLITSGPFAHVRHPMYLGAFIAGFGAVLVYQTWTTVFLLTHWPVFLLRAHREEQALAAEFGPVWEAYRRRVPGWVPHVRKPYAG